MLEGIAKITFQHSTPQLVGENETPVSVFILVVYYGEFARRPVFTTYRKPGC